MYILDKNELLKYYYIRKSFIFYKIPSKMLKINFILKTFFIDEYIM